MKRSDEKQKAKMLKREAQARNEQSIREGIQNKRKRINEMGGDACKVPFFALSSHVTLGLLS
jgi:hypothetical protein